MPHLAHTASQQTIAHKAGALIKATDIIHVWDTTKSTFNGKSDDNIVVQSYILLLPVQTVSQKHVYPSDKVVDLFYGTACAILDLLIPHLQYVRFLTAVIENI
jgi:hypothetical protein